MSVAFLLFAYLFNEIFFSRIGVFMSEGTELKRELGVGYTTLFGVGLILGAGVYVLTGEAGVLVGDSLWLSVFFATIIAVLTGLSYAEFASMYPKAASSHTYVCLLYTSPSPRDRG